MHAPRERGVRNDQKVGDRHCKHVDKLAPTAPGLFVVRDAYGSRSMINLILDLYITVLLSNTYGHGTAQSMIGIYELPPAKREW